MWKVGWVLRHELRVAVLEYSIGKEWRKSGRAEGRRGLVPLRIRRATIKPKAV